MFDLLIAEASNITPRAAALSTDAKWIIGMMATAIVALFVFMKIVLGKVFTLFENILVKEVDEFKTEIKNMHAEGISELKAIKKHQNAISTGMQITQMHAKEAKHAVQNLPCNPAKKEEEKSA